MKAEEILKMPESDNESNLSEARISSTYSSSENEDYMSVPSVFVPYQYEPLARPGREVHTDLNSETDEDGLSQDLRARYDRQTPLY